MFLFTGSIRKKLMVLVLLCSLPGLLAVTHAGLKARQQALSQAKAHALRLAKEMAITQEILAVRMRQTLSTLAELPQVKGLDVPFCQALFSRVLADNPDSLTLLLIDTQGLVLASGSGATHHGVADRSYFQLAMASQAFSPGEFIISRSANAPAFPFAVPVLGEDGQLKGVLASTINLSYFAGLVSDGCPHPDFERVLFDRLGQVVYSWPENPKTQGHMLEPEGVFHFAQGADQGVTTFNGPDSQPRIYAHKQIKTTPQAQAHLYASVSIPARQVLIQANRTMINSFALSALALLAALGLAYGLGALGLAVPAERLAQAAGRLGQGQNLDQDADIGPDHGEISSLAQSFNRLAHDLNAQKQAKEAAEDRQRLADARFRTIVHTAFEGIWTTDAAFHLTFANQSMCRILGQTEAYLLGKSLEDFTAKDYLDVLLSQRALRRQGQFGHYELKLAPPGHHEVWALISTSPLMDHTGAFTGVVGFLTDITRLKKAEAEAKSANLAKSSFLATMSHEIRTPLNGLIGLLQLCQETPLTQEQAEYVSFSLESSKRLLSLLNDILDMAKVESGKISLCAEPTDFKAILENLRLTFYPQLSAKPVDLKLEVELDPDLTYLCDPNRVRQVLFNLMGNAVKFTDLGQVAVSISAIAQPRPGQALLLFTVADTGSGIPEDKIAQLFEPFVQADSSYTRRFQGSGLGLSIVKRLVGLMGGNLCLESELGQGTTMAFTILADCAPTQGPEPAQALGSTAPGQLTPACRVLLVEDEKVNQLVISRMLQKMGINAQTAANGHEAVKMVADNRFDLVLMDVQMPYLDGVGATKVIREGLKNTSLPIIAVTAHAMPGDMEACLNAGMNGYISKPVVLSELRQVIIRHCPQAKA